MSSSTVILGESRTRMESLWNHLIGSVVKTSVGSRFALIQSIREVPTPSPGTKSRSSRNRTLRAGGEVCDACEFDFR